MGNRVFQFDVFVTAMPDQTQEDVREHLKSVVVRGMLLGPGGKELSKRFVAVRITGGDFVGRDGERDGEPDKETTARQEHLAECEMVQAMMPVVNEDGGR